MPFTYSAHEILNKAHQQKYAIGAFNAANLETIKAIVQAADHLRSPVIIESSSGETDYIGAENLVDVVENYRQQYQLPILVNLDHSPSEEAADIGINAGYDLIHIDTSELPYDQNLQIVTRVAQKAHAKNLLVEAEVDHITGSSNFHQEGIETQQQQGHYTNPDQALDFVARTGIDTFASFVGNVHGLYLNQPKTLNIPLLQQIAGKVKCFLSLHGGSGIPDGQIQAAISAGIVKININSELRLAYRDSLKQALSQTEELAIYKITPPAIATVQKIVEQKILLFGSAGKA